MQYLFVYGTLLDKNLSYLGDFLDNKTEYIGKGYAYGKLFDLGDYPAFVPDQKAGDKVFGKVFLLSDPNEVLILLDDYEGTSNDKVGSAEYSREEVSVTLESGKNIVAWIYVYLKETDNLKRIESGDYLNYLNNSDL